MIYLFQYILLNEKLFKIVFDSLILKIVVVLKAKILCMEELCVVGCIVIIITQM